MLCGPRSFAVCAQSGVDRLEGQETLAIVSGMPEPQTDPRWLRVVFGKPRIGPGVFWLLFGFVSFVVAIAGNGRLWQYLIAACWVLLGATLFTVALRDRRLGRGAYARPNVDQ